MPLPLRGMALWPLTSTETLYVARPDFYEDSWSDCLDDLHADSYRGWLGVDFDAIKTAWFERAAARGRGIEYRFPHLEEPQGSGIYHHGTEAVLDHEPAVLPLKGVLHVRCLLL